MMACAFCSLSTSAWRASSCRAASATKRCDSKRSIQRASRSAGSTATAPPASNARRSTLPAKWAAATPTAPTVTTTISTIASARRPHKVTIQKAPAAGECSASANPSMMHIRLQAVGRQFSTPQDYGLPPEKWLENDKYKNNSDGTRVTRSAAAGIQCAVLAMASARARLRSRRLQPVRLDQKLRRHFPRRADLMNHVDGQRSLAAQDL